MRERIAEPWLLPWRTGRRNGRAIYLDVGEPDPNDGSLFIGALDTVELAERAVEDHNRSLEGGDVCGACGEPL